MLGIKKDLQFHDLLFFILLVFSFYFTRNNICRVMMVAFFGYTILRMIIRRQKITIPFFCIGSLGFIIYGFVNIYAGNVIYKNVAQTMAISLTLNFLMLFAIIQYVLMQQDITKVLSILELSILTTTLIVLLMSLGTITQGRLATGTEMNANMLSMLCVYGFILTMYLYKIKNITMPSFLIREAIFLSSILLTGSRKGFIMVILAIMIINISGNVNIKKILRGTLIGIAVAIFLYVIIMNVDFLYNIMGNRIENMLLFLINGSTSGEGSLESRQELIQIGLRYIKNKPWTGYGLDCFKMVSGFFGSGKVSIGQEGYYSHNNYIELLFGTGIIGTVIYYIPMASLLKDFIKALKKNECVVYLLAIFVTKLAVEYAYVSYYQRVDTYIIAVMLGCILIVQQAEKTQKKI